MTSLVRMLDDMPLVITGTTIIIYSVHEHGFESHWLCNVNHGNSYSSLVIF